MTKNARTNNGKAKNEPSNARNSQALHSERKAKEKGRRRCYRTKNKRRNGKNSFVYLHFDFKFKKKEKLFRWCSYFFLKKKAEMTTQSLEQTKGQLKQLETKLEELQLVNNLNHMFLCQSIDTITLFVLISLKLK